MASDNDAAPAVDPNILKGNEIARAVIGAGLKPDDFHVDFRNGVATLTGTVRTVDERNRVLQAARTVGGVANVNDTMKMAGAGAAPAAGAAAGAQRSYTVKSGDTLSKIAKELYGDAAKYNRIFDANRNILSDPDKIQPGQVLVIPA